MSSTPILRRIHFALRGALLTTPWLLHLTLADIALSALLPLSVILPSKVSYDVASALAYSVWRSVQKLFTSMNGARITVSGDKPREGESAIVVANHVSWTDFYMIQELALQAGMLGRCRWFAKAALKWVPFLGWGLWAMGMPLVSRKWTEDERELQKTFGGIVKGRRPIWLISYVEGTRYTPSKHSAAVSWCKSNGKAVPLHTLHPRTKGFVATVSTLRQAPQVKAVYDVTVAYARGDKWMAAPTMWETMSRPSLSDDEEYRFHVHLDRFDLEDLPKDGDKLAAWLEERWVAKGQKLEELRAKLEAQQPWS